MINIKVRGLDELKKFISELPRRARGLATQAAAEYFVGDGGRGLKRYPPYRHITRKSAYPPTGWQSEKQRRYVMARIRDGSIDPGYPHRTGNYQRGWGVKGDGVKATIYNSVPYADFVGGEGQANLNKKVGWRKFAEIIASNMRGAMQAAERAVDAWIKSRQ